MRSTPHSLAETMSAESLACFRKPNCKVSPEVFSLSLGTLGDGNHFWELDRDEYSGPHVKTTLRKNFVNKAVC